MGENSLMGGGLNFFSQKSPNFNLWIWKTQGVSQFFKNILIKSNPQTPSKITRIGSPFWYFLMQTCLFNVCLRGYTLILTFFNEKVLLGCGSGARVNSYTHRKYFLCGQPPSTCSQFQKCLKLLRWGGGAAFFQKCLKIKKVWIIWCGWGQA